MATVRRPGEGERIGGPSRGHHQGDGGGHRRFALSVRHPWSRGSPVLRSTANRELHDMFYVLEASPSVTVGDETLELEAGSFACIPPGTPHTFANTSDQPVRFLNFNTPAGWENYMRDLGELLASGDATREAIGRIASRYDFEAAPGRPRSRASAGKGQQRRLTPRPA